MYSCDICTKDHWGIENLRTLQVRMRAEEDDDEEYIWTIVCCTDKGTQGYVCADRVRTDPDLIAVLSDEPFKGIWTAGHGYT